MFNQQHISNQLISQLQAEVAESIAEYQAGGSFDLDEIRREFGLAEQ